MEIKETPSVGVDSETFPQKGSLQPEKFVFFLRETGFSADPPSSLHLEADPFPKLEDGIPFSPPAEKNNPSGYETQVSGEKTFSPVDGRIPCLGPDDQKSFSSLGTEGKGEIYDAPFDILNFLSLPPHLQEAFNQQSNPSNFKEEEGGRSSPPSEKMALKPSSSNYNRDPFVFANFPSLLNEKVTPFINFFQTRADDFFSRGLARSRAYEVMMKKIFREKNLPEELFYLALIESGYNPHAFSRAKASGIWQFLGKTGKQYGLKVDNWVDERRDPEKSTYAAAEYLKNLYEIFNCWFLATAGYNAGEGKVRRAMKKSKSQDFWTISQNRYLKRETKRYVPMFLAAVAIAKEPQKYGFANIAYHPPLVYEKVWVPPATSLQQIAKAAEIDLVELKALNPALKRGLTPPDTPQFEIKLPPGKKEIFAKTFPLLEKSRTAKNKKHRVQPGESLSRIAKRYQVELRSLCELNSLTLSARIYPGSVLLLPSYVHP